MDDNKTIPRTGMEIAIIGMAGRFPGAKNITEFWNNLKNHVESISEFSDAELIAEGINQEILANPNYVKANGAIDGVEYFDSFFFGYSSEEAMIMNPQLRIFHECVWEALEDAGYNPDTYKGLIGLYAGAASSVEWQAATYLSGESDEFGQFASNSFTDKDYLCSKISYKLNLKGPSYSINTACSTSLVSVHVACRALLTGECSLALAGGINIMNQQKTGYLYEEGMVVSPDGHCRAFDEKSMGTVPGNGAGIVVLKLLKNALADGDNIYAVIKGSAINNDGGRKVGFAAPSIEGQSEVIRIAQRAAKIEPESISYIEAHGTGTVLGDPVEISALNLAFRTEKRNFCAVGSVKTNIGHLDVAAGIAGLIKTTLALKHKQIPPSLNFRTQNPRINFENSPFYVNDTLQEWRNDIYPLRAGVSSFGIGGTNAHIILEEMKELEKRDCNEKWNIISLSAKTEDALERMKLNFANYFKNNPDVCMSDVAYTLHIGRQHFKYRTMLVCNNAQEAFEIISSNHNKMQSFKLRQRQKSVVFMFSGLGSQYVDMGLDLYRKYSSFHLEVDHCFDILYKLKGIDIKNIIYPQNNFEKAQKSINEIFMAQIVTFVFEYSLGKLLMKWGIKPQAMIGYSFGEYAAACLSGIFSLEDALDIIITRGELMQQLEEGLMLSVPLSRDRIRPLIDGNLSIAVSNYSSCIISGPCTEIVNFEKKMKLKKLLCMRVNTSRAVHSCMMEPIMERFEDYISKIKLNHPQIPLISNVTGTWMKPNEATDPSYWAKHLRSMVKFDDGISELLKVENSIFVEVGPGRDLSLLIERYLDDKQESCSINLIRPQNRKIDDNLYLMNKVGHLWLYGIDIEWKEFYSNQQRRRISIPTYPFEKKYYKVQQNILTNKSVVFNKEMMNGEKEEISNWFYQPLWQQSNIPSINLQENVSNDDWLIFTKKFNFNEKLTELVIKRVSNAIIVMDGEKFERINNNTYIINLRKEKDYEILFADIRKSSRIPANILHLWSINEDECNGLDDFDSSQDNGINSLLSIARAIGKLEIIQNIKIKVIINNLQKVTGDEIIYPPKATILGAIKIINVEYVNLSCSIIDIPIFNTNEDEEKKLLNNIFKELVENTDDIIVAYRGRHRWVQVYQHVQMTKTKTIKERIKCGGVYVIAGGFGGMGYTIAQYLAKDYKAKLVLIGRSIIPPRDEWDKWISSHSMGDSVSVKIRKVLELENLGAEVLVRNADVANIDMMKPVMSDVIKCFGEINGVIHAAGVIDFGGVIQRRSRDVTEELLNSKVKGTLIFEELLKNIKIDFMVLFSSFTNVMYTWKFGQVSYVAANEFLDSYSYYMKDNDIFTVTINWSDWQEVGMAIETINLHYERNSNGSYKNQFKNEYEEFLKESINPSEGIEVFKQVLNNSFTHLIISPKDLNNLLIQQSTLRQELSSFEGKDEKYDEVSFYPKPELYNEYVAPRNHIEQKLQELFERFFCFKKIGVNDDFFDLGGDSLKAMSMISKIYRAFNLVLTLQKFFENPTIKGIAKILVNQEESKEIDIQPTKEAKYYQLSSMQKRLIVLDKLQKNTAYNMTRVMVIEGELDKEKLQNTFKLLIERHEALRTSFEFRDEEYVQIVHKFVEFKMDYFEIHDEVKDIFLEENINKISQDFIGTFDLSSAPIFRAKLLKLGENRHVIMYDTHHIISDGISMNLLERDILSIYNGEILHDLRIHYKDFVEWQNKRYQAGLVKKQEEYWINRFSDEIPILNMPLDFTRPLAQSFEGDSISFQIDMKLTDAINKLAVKNSATIYMVLLAAYNILLLKYTGQEDIIVGSPISGRVNETTDNTIGLFINILLMRNFPKNDMTFIEFLNDVKKNSLEAYENQEYQFEKLIEKLKLNVDLSRNSLFDTMFTLHSSNFIKNETENMKLKSLDINNNSSRFDFTLDIIEREGILDCSLEYCTKLFKKETMQRFKDHYINILSRIIDDPRSKLSEIDMLSQAEKNQLLINFNNTKMHYPRYKTINVMFEEQVEKSPYDIALKFKNISITYQELNGRANQLARLLRERGAGKGSIIGLKVKRSIEMIVGILGILKAGGAYLPIDYEYPSQRIFYMLQDSNTKILITEKEDCNSAEFDGTIIDINDESINQFENTNTENLCISDDMAYVIYTSGSTGKPKGVVLEHKSVTNFINGVTQIIDFNHEKTIINLTTVSFDIFVLETILPLTRGLSIVIADEQQQKDPKLLSETILTNNVSMLQITPSRLTMLLNRTSSHACFMNLKEIMIGGEELPINLLQKLQSLTQVKIYNMYGPTETTVWSTIKELTKSKKINIGKPISNTYIYILDANSKLVPIGIPGELYISGDGLARGYYNRPKLNEEKFTKNLFHQGERMYRTGDYAMWLDNGEIQLIGRMDRQVKIRGFRIEVGEIENQLLKNKEIKEAIVIERNDNRGIKYLCAYIVCDREFTVQELREELSLELPDYMIPSNFIQLERLPLTPNGKIDIKSLPKSFGKINTGSKYMAPRNEVEEKLVKAWGEVLDIDKIGIDDDFFALGGHSLKAIKVEVVLENMGLNVEFQKTYEYKTIRKIAEYLYRLENNSAKIYKEDNIIENAISEVEILNKDIETSTNNEVILNNIEPFNEIFFKSCFYNSFFPIIKHFNKNELSILINDVIVYSNKESSDLFNLSVDYLSAKTIEQVITETGINYLTRENPDSLIQDIIYAIDNNKCVIVWIDCYYMPIRKDTYLKEHEAHSLLIYGYNKDKNQFNVIEQLDSQSLTYSKCVVKFNDIVESYQGYLINYSDFNQVPSYFECGLSYKEKLGMVGNECGTDIYLKKYLCNIKAEGNKYITQLENLKVFMEKLKIISGYEFRLLQNANTLIGILNNIINAKQVERYKIQRLFNDTFEGIKLLNEIIDYWIIIRSILVKYTITSEYKQKSFELVAVKMEELYKLECEYCNIIFNLSTINN